MRYFLVSYAHKDGFGEMSFGFPGFPSKKFMIANCEIKSPIVIVNIYEFKNELDSLAFNSIKLGSVNI